MIRGVAVTMGFGVKKVGRIIIENMLPRAMSPMMIVMSRYSGTSITAVLLPLMVCLGVEFALFMDK